MLAKWTAYIKVSVIMMETHNWSRFWRQKCVDFLHTKWFMQNGYEIKNVYYSTNFVAAASVAGAAGSNKMKWWWQMDAINVKWARRKAPIKTGLFDTPFAIVHARVHVHASSPYSICECTNYIFITLTIMKSFSFFCIYNHSVWMWNLPFFLCQSVKIADKMPKTWHSFCLWHYAIIVNGTKKAMYFFQSQFI